MTPGKKEINILLVDDSKIVLNYAGRVLGQLDVNLCTADNGANALEHMQKNKVDLLITDIMMPKMNGFELISKVREDNAFNQVYIIVMTSLDEVENKVRALDLGANDYTVKPLDTAELKARVQAGIRELFLKKELTSALNSLDNELKLVAKLQKRLLPKKLIQEEKARSAVFYMPCSRAGGDYYDYFEDEQGRLILAIADVSGHGASAAVLTAMFRALLRVTVPKGKTAAEIIELLNNAIVENIGQEPDFITAFLAIFDRNAGTLNICSAGHGDMILLGPERGRIKRFEAGGTVLGFFKSNWDEEFIDVEPGQFLVLYTDGLVEAVNGSNEEFGYKRLEKILGDVDVNLEPDDLIQLILSELEYFTDRNKLMDDLTIFVQKYC